MTGQQTESAKGLINDRTNRLANAIRHRILNGEFAPGQRLIEADLCSEFNASRRQVREALASLAHEGLVQIVANRGARVRIVKLDEALQLAEARFALERLCIERAAKHIKEKETGELQLLAQSLRTAVDSGDVFLFRRSAASLQACIVAIADQPVVSELLQRLRDRSAWMRNRLTFQPGWPQASLPYRLKLIDALCRRDGHAAVEAQRGHYQLWCDTMRRMANSATDETVQ